MEAAFNVARKNSIRLENDLMQEDMMDNSMDNKTPPGSPHSHKECFKLLNQIHHDAPLPQFCEQFQDVKVALQRKNSNRHSHAVAFEGMSPAEAAAAMAARERGQLHHAQIQRRLTSGKKKRLW